MYGSNVLFRPLCMAVMYIQTIMYGSNVIFRPSDPYVCMAVCMAVMSYSDDQALMYVIQTLMYGCNALFRRLCMAIMSYSDRYVWL